jgi:hypothetical protein
MIKRFIWIALFVFSSTIAVSAGHPSGRPVSTPDAHAGYADGCQSARGHYTRSRYKYRHSTLYKQQWRKGYRACKRKKRTRTHRVKRPHTSALRCDKTTENPWDAFRRGWRDGLRSAKGHFRVDRRGCAPYRRGWISGYRSCKCPKTRRADTYDRGYYHGCNSVIEYKIKDEYQFGRSVPYRNGWNQGWRDCRSIYRR